MVDWRKIPKIDAHIHLTPKDVIDANIDYDGRFIVNGSIDDYEKYEELYGLNAYFNLSAVLPDLVDRIGIENTNIVLRSLGG